MNYPYIVIDDNQESVLKTKAIADGFSELVFVASANNYTDGLNLILEHTPKIVFLEIDPADKTSNLSLQLINELYRYLKVVPKIIVTTTKKELAFDAIQFEVADYLIKPVQRVDLVKTLLKLKKAIGEDEVFLSQSPMLDASSKFVGEPQVIVSEQASVSKKEQPLVLCIKSYGDYRYIDARDICYFQADNNSTDIHLNNGEMITAFKTLKHFESVLPHPFSRIHNSYIVNRHYISRIHTGNAVCYIKNSTTKLPFSKSYKENVDLIISEFANGNYLEI
ncbi:LytR/AlgR family response regulator transcription factor [Flavobacterium eburneipallidum]|uniref:LytR/AlgR family response regulator transcription factor n=1 Tax=Flavobacterium eburneipallidum TaxID=3003263 RepID=UPI0022AC63A9|nr:LytTR family DNA-binding domain-containing protein [Flavobacterium eburneipallidum]